MRFLGFWWGNQRETTQTQEVRNMRAAVEFLLDWLEKSVGFGQIAAVGH